MTATGPSAPGRRQYVRPRSARATIGAFAAVAALTALWMTTATGVAQTTSVPPGFDAHTTFQATAAVPFLHRALALPANRHMVAIGGTLWLVGPTMATLPQTAPCLRLRGENIAFLAPMAGHTVLVGGLSTGRIVHLQLATGAVLGTFAGPANAFDAEALSGGDLLLNTNPAWPGPGANAGVWLAGPGRMPRLVLQLRGPSGPLQLLANGDLVVAELGPVVPPPPGAARLLRFPANLVQLAIAGGTLSTADAVDIGTGFGGIYDLAVDDRGSIYASDPATGCVQQTAPGSLVPTGTWLDAGPGRYVTSLQFVAGSGAPFAAHQPARRAPSLFVTTSDFTSSFELHQVSPERPQASLVPSLDVAPGPSTLDLHGAPPNGVCLWCLSWSAPGPEQVAAWIGGTPLWLGLPTIDTALAALPIDAQGTASLAFVHAGGFTASVHLQAVTLDSTSGSVATSSILSANLLP